MTTLAKQLDDCLRRADEKTAHRLEQIVRDALALAEMAEAGQKRAQWPDGYFQRTAGSLKGEQFERPDQGTMQSREGW